MSIWPIFSNAILDGWVNFMISALWQGSLALLLIWILLRLFPRIHPEIQCWLWRLACLKTLITFIWVKPLKLYFHLQIGLRQLGWLLVNQEPSRHLGKMTQSFLETNPTLPISGSGTGFWFILWLTGLIILLVGLFYLEYQRQKNGYSYIPVADPVIIGQYQDLGLQNKFRKMPRLFASNQAHSPLLQGIIHPKIILPASMLIDFKSDELQLILAHELAHYKRGDLFWNWLPVMVRTAFFFLPYFWWVEKKLMQLQEICCDRLALQYVKTPAAKFGRMLLEVSLQHELPKSTILSAGFASQSLELLKSRLTALQYVNQMNRRRMVLSGFILFILGVAAVIPCQLSEAQTLPVNLYINYFSPDRFELSARVMLPEEEIKTITALIDGKPISTTFNANGVYLGFVRSNEDSFPLAGPHKVTIKAQTTAGVLKNENWIYFHDSMIWCSQNLGLESNKTLIKIGPFFWVVNNRFKLFS